MKFLLFAALFLVLSSCSSSSKKEDEKKGEPVQELSSQVKTVHPQNYSPEELKRLEILDHYRKLREEAFQKLKTSAPGKKVSKKEKKKPVQKKVEKLPSQDQQVQATPEPKSTAQVKNEDSLSDEMRIQLDQHMAYYCIKYESRFSRPTDCRAHAENILKACQDKKSTTPSLNLVQCLKKNM